LNLTENWIYTQVRYLPDTVEKHIVCKDTINLEQFSLPNIHCFEKMTGCARLCVTAYGLYKLGRYFRRHSALLLWIAKQNRANIIHSHFGSTGWRYAQVAKRAGLKHIVTFYGVDVNRLPKEDPAWLECYQEMFSRIDSVLCEGPHMARCVVNLGCPKNKVRVQHRAHLKY
jgi:colanic acid/amylovoran biosynthesis glycosyltransferase